MATGDPTHRPGDDEIAEAIRQATTGRTFLTSSALIDALLPVVRRAQAAALREAADATEDLVYDGDVRDVIRERADELDPQ